jgi:hypothetical protein
MRKACCAQKKCACKEEAEVVKQTMPRYNVIVSDKV